MMNFAATSRVQTLRAAYMESEMMKHKLSYSRARRMKLLYIRGWNLHPEIASPVLRRAYADAYLLEQMTPVILPGELLLGQPDFSPLTEAEQEQLDLYIGACEAWCESHMFVAFSLGRNDMDFCNCEKL